MASESAPLATHEASKDRRVDGTRQKIVVAAFESLRRFGTRRMTIEDVARHAGVSRPTVYAHFSNKETLVEAALLWNGHLMRVELEKRLRRAETFADKVAAAAVFGVTSDLLNLGETEPVAKAVLLTIDADPWVERATDFWAPIVQQAAERGEVRRELDVRTTAHWVARSLFSLSLTVEASPPKSVLRELEMWARTYIAGGLAYHVPE